MGGCGGLWVWVWEWWVVVGGCGGWWLEGVGVVGDGFVGCGGDWCVVGGGWVW